MCEIFYSFKVAGIPGLMNNGTKIANTWLVYDKPVCPIYKIGSIARGPVKKALFLMIISGPARTQT
jgi:hypothetical protein